MRQRPPPQRKQISRWKTNQSTTMGRTGKATSSTQKHPTTTEECEKRIVESLKNLHKKVQKSHEKKKKIDETLSSVDTLQDKIRADNKLTTGNKTKLKNLYTNALKESEVEAEHLRACLAEIAYIRKLKMEKRVLARKGSATGEKKSAPIRRGALMVMLQQAANTLPLWIGKLGENPPSLCGAVPEESGHVCQVGDAVAALVKGDEGEENWILAEVVSVPNAQGKYEVEDVDEEQKERYQLPKKKVVGLPMMRANPQTDPDALFPQDAVVMALYPQTTCFYKGVVEQIPVQPTEDYLVAFEDASYPQGFSPPLPVPQRYVIAYREAKTNSK